MVPSPSGSASTAAMDSDMSYAAGDACARIIDTKGNRALAPMLTEVCGKCCKEPLSWVPARFIWSAAMLRRAALLLAIALLYPSSPASNHQHGLLQASAAAAVQTSGSDADPVTYIARLRKFAEALDPELIQNAAPGEHGGAAAVASCMYLVFMVRMACLISMLLVVTCLGGEQACCRCNLYTPDLTFGCAKNVLCCCPAHDKA